MLPYETTGPNKFLPVKKMDLSFFSPVFDHCLELILVKRDCVIAVAAK